jgi:hypothetical protein
MVLTFVSLIACSVLSAAAQPAKKGSKASKTSKPNKANAVAQAANKASDAAKTLTNAISPLLATVAPRPASNEPGKCTGMNGLTEPEMTALLEAHNRVRVKLKLALLTWDCALADTAQDWAQRGFQGHRPDNDFGENIFVSSSPDVAAITGVERWMLEEPSWNNKASACKAGSVCAHYTQIVWKRTTKIGCGINRNAPDKWKLLLVCNYDPAGNYPGPAY